MTDFQRENRYIVIKRSKLNDDQLSRLESTMDNNSISQLDKDCLVIEADWPEYERVWQMIEARVTGVKPPLTYVWVVKETGTPWSTGNLKAFQSQEAANAYCLEKEKARSPLRQVDGTTHSVEQLAFAPCELAVAEVIATGGPHDQEDRVLCELQAELPPTGTKLYAHTADVEQLRTQLAERDKMLAEFATELHLAMADSQVRSAMSAVGRTKCLELLKRYNQR